LDGTDSLAFRVVVALALVEMVVAAIFSGSPRAWRALALLTVGTVIVVCSWTAKSGLSPGAAIGLVSAIVLEAVFLGRRAMWWTIAVTTLFLLATGVAAHAGVIRTVDPRSYLDWSRMDTWVRLSVAYLAAAIVATSAVAKPIARLEYALADQEDAHAATDGALRRSELLAEASRVLASSLDYDDTLRQVARLSTPLLGDCCTVEVFAEDGTVRRIVEGAPELAAHRGYVSVPLIARDEKLGALTFVRADQDKEDPRDVATAEELGRRAAAAIDIGRLFQAAQRAVVVREEFLAIATQELRTPVTSLRLALAGLAQQAKQAEPSEKGSRVRRMLEVVERQAIRLHRLVDNLFDASTIARGSLPVTLSEVELTGAVRRAAAELTEPLRASRSPLTLDAPAPIVGRWDAARLETVVINLLSNAITYGEGKPIEVAVQAEGDVARLVVRDHGIGLAPDAQKSVFSRFMRAAPVQHYGGLGLGLYVVRGIVERLGGRVECASAPDQGSTFTVILPLAGPGDEARAEAGEAAPGDVHLEPSATPTAMQAPARHEPPGEGSSGSRDWRAEAFRRTSWLLLVLGGPIVLYVVFFGEIAEPWTLRVILACLLAAYVVVAILSRATRNWRALAALLVATSVGVCLIGAAKYGVVPAPAVGLVSSLVLAAVFFGRRAVWQSTAVITLALLAMGGAVHAGLLSPLDPRLVLTWGRMETWVRVSALYFLATSVAASAVSALIARLERGLIDEQRAHAAAHAARLRTELLDEASRVLASSLDYEDTLRRVAERSTPLLGDCCIVDVFGKDGRVRRIFACPPGDPARSSLLRKLEASPITEELLSELGLRSSVCVPLTARTRDRTLGALTLAWRVQEVDPLDAAAAEDLGRRAAAAVDIGRLFEAAKQSAAVRDEFLAVAAHELRTPITSMRLALQFLRNHARRDGEALPSVQKMLDIADRQTLGLQLLAETILDVSSITTESLRFSPSHADLTEVARGALARLTELLRASGSELTLDAPVPVVGYWDAALLEHVVVHLLANAIDSGQGRPIEMRVRAEDGVARLVIRDHGSGIALQIHERITGRFDPGEQYGALGLRLYAAQRIVERLGGLLAGACTPDQGSTFTVALPQLTPSQVASRGSVSAMSHSARKSASFPQNRDW
jgi:signal transduction histidine kinase